MGRGSSFAFKATDTESALLKQGWNRGVYGMLQCTICLVFWAKTLQRHVLYISETYNILFEESRIGAFKERWTLVIVLGQVFLVYVEVVVGVQLPELAVDNVEMFIREEVCQLVHVVLLLQQRQILGQTKSQNVNDRFLFYRWSIYRYNLPMCLL